MASYVAMEPPDDEDGQGTVLVRDGFHFLAFLVPFLWFFWHRLWLEGLVALAVALVIGVVGGLSGLGGVASVLSLGVSIFFGLEAAALRIAALRRRGWHEWGVVEAESLADAETRYLSEAVTSAWPAGSAVWATAPASAGPAGIRRGPSFDLLGTPGAR